MLSPDIDKDFFDIGTVTNSSTPADFIYLNRNKVRVYIKELKNGTDEGMDLYKNKYNIFFDFNDKQKIFNRKFKEPIHRLTIAGNSLKEIKTLPKGLMSLWLQGIPDNYKLKLATIPKTIVSIFYKWTDYTLGEDLSKLKNLKVFGAPDNHRIFNIPKFPKSIEYVDLSGCQINRFDEDGLDNFKVSSYPNLKYINFSRNWIRKIPAEWKKKTGVKIIYDKQRK